MLPAPTEEENNQDANKSQMSDSKSNRPTSNERPGSIQGSQMSMEGDDIQTPAQLVMDVVENDYLTKAAMLPPKDPEGEDTMVPDLILSQQKIVSILEKALTTVLDWLIAEKATYNTKAKTEGKQLQDQSVEELDENLRKQWPRKGRLEVEIYQERKGQITTHNRKYERQVKVCLDKYNKLEEEWGLILDKCQDEFNLFKHQFVKLKEALPLGKNLAQL